MLLKDSKIVVIGGGTGSFVVLSGLKKITHQITSIVSMADSGGSAKKERDEWGLLPISDVRKALIALADEKKQESLQLRNLFQYRFSEGLGLQGMTFGNLLLVALTNIYGSQEKSIEIASQMLGITGKILPVTYDSSNLVLEYADSRVIVGEHFLDNFPGDGTQRVTNLYLLPPTQINPKAQRAILEADYIIFPPGDLYGSLIANIAVKGVTEALKKSLAKKIYFLNLFTKYGQTYNFKASDHLKEIEKYSQVKIDRVIINSAPLPKQSLVYYAREKDFPVYNDLKNDPRIILTDLVSNIPVPKQKGDQIRRSLIRHDPQKIAQILEKIIS